MYLHVLVKSKTIHIEVDKDTVAARGEALRLFARGAT